MSEQASFVLASICLYVMSILLGIITIINILGDRDDD